MSTSSKTVLSRCSSKMLPQSASSDNESKQLPLLQKSSVSSCPLTTSSHIPLYSTCVCSYPPIHCGTKWKHGSASHHAVEPKCSQNLKLFISHHY
jgi:hypothetical protein